MTDLEIKYQEIYHSDSEEEFLLAGEGLESIVCKNLYQHLFNVPSEEESNRRIQE